MPRLGFSIYRVQPSETVEVVLDALDAGYRHFDSAQLYNNEAELGQAIRQSGVAREDVFLTTKIRYPGMNKAKTWKKVLDSIKKVSGVEVTTGRKRKREAMEYLLRRRRTLARSTSTYFWCTLRTGARTLRRGAGRCGLRWRGLSRRVKPGRLVSAITRSSTWRRCGSTRKVGHRMSTRYRYVH